MDRIPTQFHESFALSRSSLIKVLKAIEDAPPEMNFKSKKKRDHYIQTKTGLGNNYVKSMPVYCKGAGLLDFEYKLTNFANMR